MGIASLLFAMSAVLVSWAVLAPAVVGLGGGVWKLLRLPEATALPNESRRDGWPLFLRFWIGFAAALAILQVWHLAFRVSGYALVLLLTLGALGWITARRDILTLLRDSVLLEPRTRWILILVTLWAANRAIGAANSIDDGFYHLPVVKWISTYPIVPGLANLHATFGYNNPTFLWVAALSTGPWNGRGTHLANPLLMAIALWQSVAAASALLQGRDTQAAAPRFRIPRVFLVVMLPVVVFQAVNHDSAGAGTDLPLTIICLTAWARLVGFLSVPDPDPRHNAAELWSIAALFTLAACIKLSGAFLAVLGAMIALAIWLYRDRPTRSALTNSTAFRIVLWGTALGVPWLARSCVLSGYPLFPITALGLPVDWRCPPAKAWIVRNEIHLFARQSLPAFVAGFANDPAWKFLPRWIALPADYKPEGIGWLLPWALAQVVAFPTETVIPCVLGIAALAWRVLRRRRDQTPERSGYAWLAVIAALAGLTFWFATAPEPRYGMCACWAFGATCIALVPPTAPRVGQRAHAGIIWFSIALCAIPVLHRVAGIRAIQHRNPFWIVPFVFPGPDHGFHPVPVCAMRPAACRGGLIVNVPANNDFLIYYAPLPAAPLPEPTLTWRRPGDLRSGFRIEQP